MDFLRLCACTPAEFGQLRQCVDQCGELGRSYELRQCPMPAGCRPSSADLGVWRQGGYYFLYFRPAVSYAGENPRLRDFFAEGHLQRYDSFCSLTQALASLGGDPPPLPNAFSYLYEALRARVVGQDTAIEAAAFKLCGHISKKNPTRPLSLIFYGPTCVGKSELGKSIAPVLNRYLGQERYHLVWTELNTFTEPHSVYRLTGAPPSYAGYDDPPLLEAVRRHPYTVFMFDELDKAHPEVLKVFMSILDEGRCSARTEDSQGERELDFRRCILLFTTNTDLSAPRPPLGFAPQSSRQDTDRKNAPELPGPAGLAQRLFQADEAARCALVSSGVLREIAGRFSGLIGFQPLSLQARQQVTVRQIAALGREYGLEIAQVTPAIAQALTPKDALSQRSVVSVLEGVLTPLFLSHIGLRSSAFRLAGAVDAPVLLPLETDEPVPV